MNMKRWLISAVTLTLALGTAGAVAAFALTANGGADNPKIPDGTDSAGELLHGDPTYEQWLSDFGDGRVVTSIDDIDPNVCNAIHNINACTPEELRELGMAPISGSIMGIGQALEAAEGSEVTLSGFLLADRDGITRLCSGLLESFPPQCGGDRIDLVGFDASSVPDSKTPPTGSEIGTARWTDSQITVTGIKVSTSGSSVLAEVRLSTEGPTTEQGPSAPPSTEPDPRRSPVPSPSLAEHDCALDQAVYVTSEGQEGCVDVVVLDNGGQDSVEAHLPVMPPQVRPAAE